MMLREETGECGTWKPCEGSVFRRRKSSDMLNVAGQLRKMSGLRPFRVDFRANGRREIGDSEYNSVRIFAINESRERGERVKDYFACVYVIFPILKTTYLCTHENDLM